MPVVGPRHVLRVLGDRGARRVFHDHDLAAVWVRLCAEVGVVEIGGVLMVEDDAAVAVVARVLRAADFEGEHEVRDAHVFDQSDVQGAAKRRLVGALALVDAEDGIPVHHAMRPARRVHDVPAVKALFKVLAEDERQSTGQQRIRGVQVEAHTDDAVLVRARLILHIGRGDDGAVGQEFHAGVAAVATCVAVQQFDAVLAGLARLDVVVSADPGDEVAFGRAVERLIAEGHDHATILREDSGMAVAGEAP